MKPLFYFKTFFHLKLKHSLTDTMSRKERAMKIMKLVLNLKNIYHAAYFSNINGNYNKNPKCMITLQLIEAEIKKLLIDHIQEIRKQRRMEEDETGYIGHYALLGISSHIKCCIEDTFKTEMKRIDLFTFKKPYCLDSLVFTLLNKNLLKLNMSVRSYSYREVTGLKKLAVTIEDVVHTPIFHHAIIHPGIFTGEDSIYFPEYFAYDLKQLNVPYQEVCSFIDRL